MRYSTSTMHVHLRLEITRISCYSLMLNAFRPMEWASQPPSVRFCFLIYFSDLYVFMGGRGTVGFSQVWLRDVEVSTAPSSPTDDPGVWRLWTLRRRLLISWFCFMDLVVWCNRKDLIAGRFEALCWLMFLIWEKLLRFVFVAKGVGWDLDRRLMLFNAWNTEMKGWFETDGSLMVRWWWFWSR